MLKQRILTALVLAPLALGGVFYLDGAAFACFIGGIVLLGGWEWANMAGLARLSERLLYTGAIGAVLYAQFNWQVLGTPAVLLTGAGIWWLLALGLVLSYPRSAALWQPTWLRLVVGWLVLVPVWQAFLSLKAETDGNLLILLVLLLVWGADTGAYFAGRAFGKRKLAPRVSPGKSWAGVYGGLLAAVLIAVLYAPLLQHAWYKIALIALPAVAASVLGDLLESMFKRRRGIKDSSRLLPGHGGVMDRIDSLTAAAPVFALLLTWWS